MNALQIRRGGDRRLRLGRAHRQHRRGAVAGTLQGHGVRQRLPDRHARRRTRRRCRRAAELAWWYQFYFATERGRLGYEKNWHDFAKLIWKTASPKWQFEDATFERSAASLANPDHVAITIHNYRWRLGWQRAKPQYDALEKRLADCRPSPCRPSLMEGEANGARNRLRRVCESSSPASTSTSDLPGDVGHNLPGHREAQPIIEGVAGCESRHGIQGTLGNVRAIRAAVVAHRRKPGSPARVPMQFRRQAALRAVRPPPARNPRAGFGASARIASARPPARPRQSAMNDQAKSQCVAVLRPENIIDSCMTPAATATPAARGSCGPCRKAKSPRIVAAAAHRRRRSGHSWAGEVQRPGQPRAYQHQEKAISGQSAVSVAHSRARWRRRYSSRPAGWCARGTAAGRTAPWGRMQKAPTALASVQHAAARSRCERRNPAAGVKGTMKGRAPAPARNRLPAAVAALNVGIESSEEVDGGIGHALAMPDRQAGTNSSPDRDRQPGKLPAPRCLVPRFPRPP